MRAIYEATAGLSHFAERGRPGRKEGTRELVLLSLPYIIVYQLTEDTVHIARILHGRQRWP